MTFKDRAQCSETRILKQCFPILLTTTIHYLGTAMQLMDEVAFITATVLPSQKW